MSLLRLLTAGKSLVGLKTPDSRYQVTNERLLPQFGSKKTPFRTRGETVPTPPVTSGQEAPAQPPDSKCQKSPVLDDRSRGQSGSSVEKRAFQPKMSSQKLADWGSRCVAKFAGKLRARPAKPAIPTFTTPLMQGELSLERVKVVRNDLSDSDVDIIRRKPEATSTNRPLSVPERQTSEPADSAWSRVTGRLFGAGKI